MLSLYKETLVGLQPLSQSTVTNLQISNNSATPRHIKSRESNTYTEATFTSTTLAADGSIYFRRAQNYPRCFLWRVLDEGLTLEIRSADLVKSRHEQGDASKILRIQFSSPIIPTAVAFADSEGQDYIHGFVITEGRELYTLKLQREIFTGTSTVSDEFYRVSVPSYFTLHRPFKLYANTPYEIFVSYENGTLQRLTRKAGEDGSQWIQHNFDEKAWSLRGIVGWQGKQSVRYNGRSLDQASPAAIVALSDSTHAFTVCLNHTLRVWNLTSGQLIATKDLLDVERTPQDISAVLLNPAANTTLKLFRLGFSGQTYLVTFSPHNEGYFKFWSVKTHLTSQLELTDAFPSASLRAPDPDPSGNSVWSMTGFEVLPTDTSNVVEMCVLWRNNNIRQLVSIKLNLLDIERSWNNDWVQTVIDERSFPQPSDLSPNDVLDPSSRWVEYFLRPGNYSRPLLETALSIYQDILKFKLPNSEKRSPLAQRLSSTMTSSVNVRRYSGFDMDYDRFEADLDKQWQNFWRIAENLRERQTAPIALAVDSYTTMPWIVMADYCTAIREPNDIELLSINTVSLQDNRVLENNWSHRKIAEDGLEKVSALLKTASTFRKRLRPEMLASCRSLLEADLFQNSELPIPMRMLDFYDTSELSTEVSDETYDVLLKCLESFGGSQGLTNEVVYALLDKFPENVSKSESQLLSTEFGQDLVSAGVGDVVRNDFQILFDLLLLVVFLECEVNAEDSANDEFDGAELFSQLYIMLREYSKKDWLASHYRGSIETAGNSKSQTDETRDTEDGHPRSLLHELFLRDIRPHPTAGVPQSFTFTRTINDVIAWTREHDNVSFEDGLVHIQCQLLLNGDLDLARDFLRYQPTTAWSTYIKGRFYLATADYDSAASYFQKAAHPLARGKAIGDLHESSAGLLSILDAESFHNGLSKYFQHVLGLFEGVKCYPHTATFGHLALQSISPIRIDVNQTLKQDLLARVFVAEIKSQRYKSAYMALSRYTDTALQKSAMGTLVKSIFATTEPTASSDERLRLLQKLPLGAHSPLQQVVDKTMHDIVYEALRAGDGSPSTQIERAIGVLNVLHAYRLGLGDYRGAVKTLLEQMALVRRLLDARSDEDSVDIRNLLLSAINALSCAPADEAYILTYPDENFGPEEDMEEDVGMDEDDGQAEAIKPMPHVVLTLQELRRDYQILLDRYSRIERGDFDFAMDEDTES